MESDALTAFFTHIKTISPLPVIWPNVKNVGIEDEPMHIRISVLNIKPKTLKTNGRSRHKWILQVSVYFKENVGVFKATQKVDSVIDGIPFNTVLSSGEYTFKTTSQGHVIPLVKSDEWLFIPIQFKFQTFK